MYHIVPNGSSKMSTEAMETLSSLPSFSGYPKLLKIFSSSFEEKQVELYFLKCSGPFI